MKGQGARSKRPPPRPGRTTRLWKQWWDRACLFAVGVFLLSRSLSLSFFLMLLCLPSGVQNQGPEEQGARLEIRREQNKGQVCRGGGGGQEGSARSRAQELPVPSGGRRGQEPAVDRRAGSLGGLTGGE